MQRAHSPGAGARSICLSLLIWFAVPTHVQTFLFWGINGTPKGYPKVSAREAATWVTWGMSSPQNSSALAARGIKMVFYSNPNRVFRKSKLLYTTDESEFAHDCKSARITVRGRANQFLTDPSSTALWKAWNAQVEDALAHGQFAAVFDDTAASTGFVSQLPCRFDQTSWLAAHVRLLMALDQPVIFNGLGDGQLTVTGKRGPEAQYSLSSVIALAAAPNAVGGAFEDCYVSPDRDNGYGTTANAYWRATEDTEIAMARLGKFFICNERVDRIAMDRAFDMRLFAEASLLLTYDPNTTIVRQQFQTPSWFNLGPEVELVPLEPVVQTPATIDGLRGAGGAFVREYRQCYLAGSPVGPCAAAVNSDSQGSHPISLAGYHHTLTLSGSGIIDGGQIGISGPPPPATLAPLSATIAFQ